jgi:hypothetical protein
MKRVSVALEFFSETVTSPVEGLWLIVARAAGALSAEINRAPRRKAVSSVDFLPSFQFFDPTALRTHSDDDGTGSSAAPAERGRTTCAVYHKPIV